ncbi:MAG: hypothetical protein AAGI53_02175 [Planctomycetota bacterium]
MRSPTSRQASLAAAVLFGLGLSTLGACSGPSTRAESRLISAEFPVDLAPELPHRVYIPRTQSSADIYLTDLDPQALARALADPTDPITGTIIHLHLFVRPKPGRTPIDDTALSATVRYIVLAKGQAGIYDGGGFLLPEQRPGGDRFEATMLDASVRLSSKTEGFIDRIGRGALELEFKAERNEPSAELIARVAGRYAHRSAEQTMGE